MMKLQSGQDLLWTYLTLIFELHMRNICAKLLQNPPMYDEFTVQESCIMNIFDLCTLTVTFTFE